MIKNKKKLITQDMPEFQNDLDSMSTESKLYVDKSVAIAEKIMKRIEELGLTQKELADRMGKTEAEVSRGLAGEQNFTLRSICKFEAALEFTILDTNPYKQVGGCAWVRARYVAGFLFSPDLGQVVLIKKNKPEWQKGLLNGVGGKIEDGETPHDAMVREFKEEAGLETDKWNRFTELTGKDWSVDFFYRVEEDIDRFYEVHTTSDEEIVKIDIENIPFRRTISNLQWLIPMAIDAAENGIDYRVANDESTSPSCTCDKKDEEVKRKFTLKEMNDCWDASDERTRYDITEIGDEIRVPKSKADYFKTYSDKIDENDCSFELLNKKLAFYREQTDKVRELIFSRNDIGAPCQPLYDAIYDKLTEQSKTIEQQQAEIERLKGLLKQVVTREYSQCDQKPKNKESVWERFKDQNKLS